jgi:hypothetical protein
MPITLATQEAEIRRSAVQSQPWANSSKDPILKISITKENWWSGSRCEQMPLLQKKKKKGGKWYFQKAKI